MCAFCVRLRYANLSNIMLGISNSLFNYCNVTITLYAYILVCFLLPLAPKNANCDILFLHFILYKFPIFIIHDSYTVRHHFEKML